MEEDVYRHWLQRGTLEQVVECTDHRRVVNHCRNAGRFAKEPKAERIFRAKLDQSLAAIRKDRQFFTSDARKTITMRKLAEIEGIKASIADWEAFFSGMARLANYSKDLLNLMNNPINRATKLLKMLGQQC